MNHRGRIQIQGENIEESQKHGLKMLLLHIRRINNFGTDDIKATELVISVQLTPHSEKIVFELIRKWIVDNYSSEKMERFIKAKLELEKIEFSDYLSGQIVA